MLSVLLAVLVLGGTDADQDTCTCIGPNNIELQTPPSCCSVDGQPACNADRVCTGAVPGPRCNLQMTQYFTPARMKDLPAALRTTCQEWLKDPNHPQTKVNLTCATATKGYLTQECANQANLTLPYCEIKGEGEKEINWAILDNNGDNALGTILEVLLLLYCFVGLALICDDYLAVGLETLCRRWNVKEDVAGATFMAIGSAAPEIVINVIAAIQAGTSSNPEATKLGVSAIIGSGMVAFLLAPGLCAIYANEPLVLKRNPLIRDIVAYLVAVIALVLFISNDDDVGEIDLAEAIILAIIWVIYIIVTVFGPKFKKWVRVQLSGGSLSINADAPSSGGGRLEFDEGPEDSRRTLVSNSSYDNEAGGDTYEDDLELMAMDTMLMEESVLDADINDIAKGIEGADDDDDDEKAVWLLVISWPLRMLFTITCPNAEEGHRHERLYGITVLISFVWVAVFSFLIMSLLTNWSGGVPVILLGATVVALGGEIPDTIQSMAVAKRGFGQMAIANCVGSKIVNVGVGLGLTWILSILTTGKSIKVCDQVPIYHMALFHTAAILLFAILTVVASYVEGVKRPTLGKVKGWILVAAYPLMMGGYALYYFVGGDSDHK